MERNTWHKVVVWVGHKTVVHLINFHKATTNMRSTHKVALLAFLGVNGMAVLSRYYGQNDHLLLNR